MAVEITIDCNSDEIIIRRNDFTGAKAVVVIGKPKNMEQLQGLIYELVNILVYAKLTGNVTLTKIGEDTRTTIDEW